MTEIEFVNYMRKMFLEIGMCNVSDSIARCEDCILTKACFQDGRQLKAYKGNDLLQRRIDLCDDILTKHKIKTFLEDDK
jgi:hypothetical protein